MAQNFNRLRACLVFLVFVWSWFPASIIHTGSFVFSASPLWSAVSTSPGAQDVREKIKEIRRSLDRIKPFKVNFVQQVSADANANMPVDLEESGEILFKSDRQLKWTYLEPDYKVFLLEGDNYRFYDEDNEQLIIGKIKDRSQQWIWQLLFSDDIFEYARWDEAGKSIHIKNDRDSIDMEIIINSDSLPVKVVQTDLSGARMVYYFKDYCQGIIIPGDAFRLQVPEGVDIVRQYEGEDENEQKKKKNKKVD
jgi:outer membrane lipoprotein-sorting protein